MERYLSLIAKRLANEINDTEQQDLEDWLDESKENELLFYRLEEAWNKGKYKVVVKGHERVYNKISAQLGLTDQPYKSGNRIKSIQMHWLRMAAVFALTICIAGMWLYFYPVFETGDESFKKEQIVISNPKGQKSSFTLPDGTKVELNSGSYLEYHQSFTHGRKVRLVGEAFFEVVRDTLHPFVVNSGDVMIRVLGTSFNVQAFPFNESMSVAVVTGKVLVENKGAQYDHQPGVLLPSEMIQIDHKTGTFERRRYDADKLLAWKDGILDFNKASFHEVVERLERWYGVDFVIKRRTPITDGFTGRYNNPPLKVVLEGMSFSSEFNFTMKQDSVIIY